MLTHWGWVMHIFVNKLTIIGSDNGLSPGRHQAIIWTNAGILLTGPLEINFSEILTDIHTFLKMHLKKWSVKCPPFCLGLNVLREITFWLISCTDTYGASLSLLSWSHTGYWEIYKESWVIKSSPGEANNGVNQEERFIEFIHILFLSFIYWKFPVGTYTIIQCGPIKTRSIYFKILTKDIPYLAYKCEVWVSSMCGLFSKLLIVFFFFLSYW